MVNSVKQELNIQSKTGYLMIESVKIIMLLLQHY